MTRHLVRTVFWTLAALLLLLGPYTLTLALPTEWTIP